MEEATEARVVSSATLLITPRRWWRGAQPRIIGLNAGIACWARLLDAPNLGVATRGLMADVAGGVAMPPQPPAWISIGLGFDCFYMGSWSASTRKTIL